MKFKNIKKFISFFLLLVFIYSTSSFCNCYVTNAMINSDIEEDYENSRININTRISCLNIQECDVNQSPFILNDGSINPKFWEFVQSPNHKNTKAIADFIKIIKKLFKNCSIYRAVSLYNGKNFDRIYHKATAGNPIGNYIASIYS